MRRTIDDEQLSFEFSSEPVELRNAVEEVVVGVVSAEVVSLELKRKEREFDLHKLLIQRIRARAQHLI